MTKVGEKVPVKSEERQSVILERAWEPLAHFRAEVDRVFDDITSGWFGGGHRRRGRWLTEPYRELFAPFAAMAFGDGTTGAALDVVDKDKEIQVLAELPGMEEKDIDVRLSDGMLTIRGEKKEERTEGEEEGSYYVSERRYGSVQRSVRLPQGIDLDKVEASFKNGVLTVTLPKTAEAQEKTRKIEVKSGS